MEDLAPFLVLNFVKASLQTFITGFLLKSPSVKNLSVSFSAAASIGAYLASSFMVLSISFATIIPILAVGNSSQNSFSITNFFIISSS